MIQEYPNIVYPQIGLNGVDVSIKCAVLAVPTAGCRGDWGHSPLR
ncbi:MAG TPA: hypothetical protein PK772_05535 [Chitinophagaceae bacterium]|nr:hypothetical protein [Chitinophagaceae bacterium]